MNSQDMNSRKPTQGDKNSAARGLQMYRLDRLAILKIIFQHQGKPLFASRAIEMAARDRLKAIDDNAAWQRKMRETEAWPVMVGK